MGFPKRTIILWAPRLLGVAVALFLGVFALDALDDGAAAFLLHLIPSIILLLIVALSWRWQWIGAVAFIGVALFYTATTLERVDWILVIAGPLFIVGALYLLSWMRRAGAQR